MHNSEQNSVSASTRLMYEHFAYNIIQGLSENFPNFVNKTFISLSRSYSALSPSKQFLTLLIHRSQRSPPSPIFGAFIECFL